MSKLHITNKLDTYLVHGGNRVGRSEALTECSVHSTAAFLVTRQLCLNPEVQRIFEGMRVELGLLLEQWCVNIATHNPSTRQEV